jgi:hypothetical protein
MARLPRAVKVKAKAAAKQRAREWGKALATRVACRVSDTPTRDARGDHDARLGAQSRLRAAQPEWWSGGLLCEAKEALAAMMVRAVSNFVFI